MYNLYLYLIKPTKIIIGKLLPNGGGVAMVQLLFFVIPYCCIYKFYKC